MRITKTITYFIMLFFVIQSAGNIYSQVRDDKNSLKSDPINRLYVLTNYKWENGQWIATDRNSYKYDEKGTTTEQEAESWINGAWVSMQRYSYQYDLIGSTMFYINRSWIGWQWVNKTRHSSSFLQPNTTESLTEVWNNIRWVNSSKSISTNDQAAKTSEYISLNWDSVNSIWINSQRSVSEFDSLGRTIKSVSSSWQSGWINGSQTIYVYDGEGNTSEIISQTWQYGAWVNTSRTSNKYDANRINTENIYQMWLSNDWVNIFRHSYNYNSGGRIIEDLSYKWNFLSPIWDNDTKLNYSYDASGSLLETVNYNWVNGVWVNNRKSVYYYQSLVTAVKMDENIKQEFQLYQNYPNPFNPTTTINYSIANDTYVSFIIYDALGREVITLAKGNQKSGYHEVRFNAGKYTSGVYYYVLRAVSKDGGKIFTKKMILIK